MASRAASPRWVTPEGWVVTMTALTLLLACGVFSFGPVFGGPQGWIAAGGGAVIGLVLAFVSASLRWSWLEVFAATLVSYLLFGGALALPKTTIAGLVPTLDTLQRLVPLTAFAWRDLLTVSLPASLFSGPAVVPYLAALVASVVGGSVALRTSRRGWALVPAGALLLVGILWGLHRAPLAAFLGAGFGAVGLAWLSWSARQKATADASDLLGLEGMSGAARRSFVPAAVIVLVATALAVGSALVLVPQQRFVLRDVLQPPLDLHQYASPLTLFRSYERDLHDETLMTVTGVPSGARVRLAALDAYDGVVYNVDEASAAYVRVGSTIGQELDLPGQPVTVGVSIHKYAGVWLPGGGDLRGITFTSSLYDETVYYNRTSGTALTTSGVTDGDAYDVSLVPPVSPAVNDVSGRPLARVTLPSPTNVPESVTTKAQDFVGSASTPYEVVSKLAKEFQTRGFYSNGSDGKSLSGHTAARIGTLLTAKQMIGDDEQYAVAMALMCRQLGIPARVVMGFYPKPGSGSTWTITGADAHVWVEVAFDQVGWVSFDPTPDRSKTPDTDVPQPKTDPKPQVLPPPQHQDTSRDNTKDIIDDPNTKKNQGQPTWLRWLLGIGTAVGGAALVASPFILIVALKRKRRTRRLADESAPDRAHGGWLELVDCATDLGSTIEPRATRREESVQIDLAFAQAGSVAVAERIDAAVFGESDPSDDEVAAVWAEVDSVLGRMATDVPRWRRAVAIVSPRSLGLTRRQAAAWLAALPGLFVGAGRAGLHRIATRLGRKDRHD